VVCQFQSTLVSPFPLIQRHIGPNVLLQRRPAGCVLVYTGRYRSWDSDVVSSRYTLSCFAQGFMLWLIG